VDETCRLKRQFVSEASVKKLLYYDDKNILVTVATSMMLTLHSVSDEGDATETMKVAEFHLVLFGHLNFLSSCHPRGDVVIKTLHS